MSVAVASVNLTVAMVDEERPESMYTDKMKQNTYPNYYEIVFMLFISLNFKLRYLTMLVGESTAQCWWFSIRSIP